MEQNEGPEIDASMYVQLIFDKMQDHFIREMIPFFLINGAGKIVYQYAKKKMNFYHI